MGSRGQVSVEFMAVLAILFSLLLFCVFVFNEKQSEQIFSREQFQSKLAADKIARTVNTVFLAGNGTQTKIVLEKDLDYSAEFFENAVQVKWRNNFSDSALLTSNVTAGTVKSGSTIKISNNNGGIVVETV